MHLRRARVWRPVLVAAALCVLATLVAAVMTGAADGSRRYRDVRVSAESAPVPPRASPGPAALAHASRLARARLRWLESPAARAQRIASQTAFHSLPSAAAQRLLKRDYGSLLAGVAANPGAALAASGHVVRYLNDYQAVVDTSRNQRELETSTVPLRATLPGRGKRAVDLDLHPVSGGFSPIAPAAPVLIPSRAAGGTRVGSQGLRVALVGANALGTASGSQSVFYPNVAADTDAVVTPTAGGVDLATVLRSRWSPGELRYQLTLPAEATLRAAAGGATVVRAGKILARIPSPSARDAEGSPVAVQMDVSGKTLILSVAGRGTKTAYPVFVDPEVIAITESAENWTFGWGLDECAEAKPHIFGEPPSSTTALSISAPLTDYPLEDEKCNGPERSYKQREGFWSWNGSRKGRFVAEFYNVSLSDSVKAEPEVPAEGVYYTFDAGFPGCGYQYSQGDRLDPPRSIEIVAGTPTGPCTEEQESKPHVAVGLTVGEVQGGSPVAVSAVLSVGAVLIGESIPAITEAEEYGRWIKNALGKHRCLLGHPVNCATGNQVVTGTDLSVGGRGAGLDWTRTYNSQLAVHQHELVPATPGTLGYGWTGSYSAYLQISSEPEEILVHEDDGNEVQFIRSHGQWVPTQPLVQATLVELAGSYTYTLPDQTKLSFSAAGLLTSETDRNGNTTTMNRNSEGRLESVSDSSARKLSLTYNSNGEIESVSDPMHHTVKYTYELGNLAAVTLPGETSPRWRFGYNELAEMTTEQSGRGNTIKTDYNSEHRVDSQVDAMGRERQWEYSIGADGSTTHIAEPNGSITQEEFNAQGLPLNVTRAAGTEEARTTQYSYDISDNLIEVVNPNETATTYRYDAAGDRTSEKNPDGNETKWEYDATHDVIGATSAVGEKTTIERDSHGNAIKVSRPVPGEVFAQATTYKYDAHGDLESMTDSGGDEWTYEYDTYGDRTAEIDPAKDKRVLHYNEDSQATSTVSPREFTTTIARDAQGRRVKVVEPLEHETKYSYDEDGNLKTVTDPEGHTTTYSYNADDEPTKVERPKTTTEISYNSEGQITEQSDGNKHATKYARNVLGEITEETNLVGLKTTTEYDEEGNVISVTDPEKRTTSYKYDPANRLTEVSYSDGKTPTVKYEYNTDGNRTKMTDGTGESTYTYDKLDRLTETQDGHGDTTKYQHNNSNQLTKVTYPNGKAVTRTYFQARLWSVTDWLERTTRFEYNKDSDVTASIFPSATSDEDTYAYDSTDAMNEVAMKKGTETLASLLYARNKDGEVTKATTKGLPGEEKPAYAYDENDRLTKGAGIKYAYDPANNPTTIGESTYAYNNADELEKVAHKSTAVATYTYNEAGERTKATPATGPATTYGYDQAGNLTSVSRPKEGETPAIEDSYAYNGEGLRTSETTAGSTGYLAWGSTEVELPLILSNGTDSFIYGPNGIPVEQINNGTGAVQYLHHDQQSTSRLITGESGKTEATFTYGAYGELTGHTGTATAPLGYDAQYTSPDTGLIYMRARTYDPATAQFLTRDPWVGLTGEPYSYTSDNPLTWADPTGRCGFICIGGFVLGGVAVATGVGEVVGAAIVIGDATVSLGAVSAVTGLAGAGADLKECIGGSNISCVGATVSGVGAIGAFGVAVGVLEGTAASGAAAIGISTGGISFLSDVAGALASTNSEATTTAAGCG